MSRFDIPRILHQFNYLPSYLMPGYEIKESETSRTFQAEQKHKESYH